MYTTRCRIMWGTWYNLEKDRATEDCEIMGVFVPKCSQTHRKGYKIHVWSDCEEGELPLTLRWFGPPKPEF